MIMTKNITFIFFVSLVFSPIYSHTQEEYAQWKRIHTGIQVAYFCADEDSSGTIWFGSGDGPVKYDGNEFVLLEYPEYIVNSVLVDTADNVWFGTNRGVYVYDDTSMTLIENDCIDYYTRTYELALDKDGSIWVATIKGLRHFKDNQWRMYRSENPWEGLAEGETIALFIDSNGNKWVSTSSSATGYTLVKYDNSVWYGFDENDGWEKYSRPLSFTDDLHGNIWISAGNDGIFKYDGEKMTKMTSIDIYTLNCSIDKEGYLWFVGNGILLNDNGNWLHFTGYDSIIFDRHITFVFVDSKENRWFGEFKQEPMTLLTSGKIQLSNTRIQNEENENNNHNVIISISPNPSNSQTTIKYYVPVKGRISIEIYNILGQKVTTLLPETEKFPGEYYIRWDGKNQSGAIVPSGVYFCLYSYNDRNKVVKFTVLK